MSELRPAIFLDRDGTILIEKDYLSDPDAAELYPGVPDALRRLQDAGFALVVVSNQSGIARGLYGEDDYRAVDVRMKTLLAMHDVFIEASYHCPHHPDFGAECDCRKPEPGMFERAIRELALDARRSWLIGDRLRDLAAAPLLDARAILVLTGYGADEADARPPGVIVARDLSAAAHAILNREVPRDPPPALGPSA